MQQVPDLRRLDLIVPSSPHLHFAFISPVKTVRHHAMLVGKLPGEHICLHGPSNTRKARHQRRQIPSRRQRRKPRHRRQILPPQARYRKQNDMIRHSCRLGLFGGVKTIRELAGPVVADRESGVNVLSNKPKRSRLLQLGEF